MAALQELLGHSSIVTTQRYARLDDAQIRDEAARLEARLSPKSAPVRVRSVENGGVSC